MSLSCFPVMNAEQHGVSQEKLSIDSEKGVKLVDIVHVIVTSV